jgi:O-acetyl-ADP-ribose deacetylase (regulator of RNase III)
MNHECQYDADGAPCKICGLTVADSLYVQSGGIIAECPPRGVIEVNADLLEYELDGFIHQANCFKTMGAGIARRIRQKYPELYEADMKYGKSGDRDRLGTFSTVKCHDDKQGYNLYGQYNFGYGERHTNYEAVYTGLVGIARHAVENNVLRLGLPKNMGCRLAGGSWNIVRAIIGDVFDGDCGITLYICNYDG